MHVPVQFPLAILLVALAASGQEPPKPPSGTVLQVQAPSLTGAWEGALELGSARLRLVLKVSRGADGGLKATADSPDQRATDLPVDTITLMGQAVHFEMTRLGASFDGTLAGDGTEIAGQFRQGGAAFPLRLRRTETPSRPTAVNRPQEPKPPYPYTEVEVVYENRQDGVRLAGTLTLPRTQGPFPAALLITGSGAEDRNETVFGHRPFLVLADHLTRQGIAVLRVDDRGVGGSTGSVDQSTTEAFARDVQAGVAFLRARPEIDGKRIGLVGHSEGGLIAPMVAARSRDIAFIVLLAGPGLPGEEILTLQGELIAKAAGASPQALARQRATQAALFEVLKREKDDGRAEKALRALLTQQLEALPEAQRKGAGDVDALLAAQVKPILTPWFRFFLTYDPRPALRQVTCPVLALNGGKDLQVPPKENLAELEKALRANRAATIQELPGLNHLFQTCSTGHPSEYGTLEETFAPAALRIISDWVLRISSRK
jgi:uncharacterized protein